MRPQQANSQALEKQMDSQVKLRAPLWPEMLGWLQQAEPIGPVPVTRPAMRANSLALEKPKPQSLEKQMDSQVKLRVTLWPVMLG
jgi:hypothetical protein